MARMRYNYCSRANAIHETSTKEEVMESARLARANQLFINACRAKPSTSRKFSTHECEIQEAWNIDRDAVYRALSAEVTLATHGAAHEYQSRMSDAWKIVGQCWGDKVAPIERLRLCYAI